MTSRRKHRTDKPRPNDFHESLSPVLPSVPLYPLGSRVLPRSFTRYGFIVLWALVVVLAGIGIGLAMISISNAGQSSEPPRPVATQTLGVSPVVADAQLTKSAPFATGDLKVVPANPVDQSSVGDVSQVALVSIYQSAAGPQQLSPGFNNYGLGQGETGTAPIQQ